MRDTSFMTIFILGYILILGSVELIEFSASSMLDGWIFSKLVTQ